jgi:type IV pilus biogenesis protein PilP
VKSGPRVWLTGLLATLVMALVLIGTSNALRDAGPWAVARLSHHRPPPNPYEGLERLIANGGRDALPSTVRDPFGYVTVAPAPGPVHVVVRAKPAPVVEMPKVTAIVSDGADARANIEYNGRTHRVGVGDTFDEYKVISITDSAVTVESNGKQIVLHPGSKGD